MDRPVKAARDPRIDFFRGLALIFIFIDHVPDNPLGLVTLRAFGLCDASEVFVLLAGYSAGLAYASTYAAGGISAAFHRAGSRAFEIYAWHIAVFVVSGLLLAAAAYVFNDPAYVRNIAISELGTEKVKTLLSAMALIYQPNMMNILPMYVVLMFWLPVVLIMVRRSPALALAVSAALWLVVFVAGLNLPVHQRPQGWYFNPFAWQLLFTIGIIAAHVSRRAQALAADTAPLAKWKGLLSQPLFLLAVAYLIFACVMAAPWVPISWLPSDPLVSRKVLGPISKMYLSPWRLIHVLALAYVVAMLLPKGAPWLGKHWARAIGQCGRHSLEIFSLGILLSFLGWIVLKQAGHGLLTVLLVNVTGVAIMGGAAWNLSRRKAVRTTREREALPAQAFAS